MQPQNNTKIVDKYLIFKDKPLGEGNFGKVFYCEKVDNPLEKFAAKEMEYPNDPQKQNLITNEIDILLEINTPKYRNNPNVIRLHQSITTNRHIYLFFDYCKDGSLSDWIDKKKKGLTELEAVTLFRQILNGFRVLQALNIIHRDIKLENILLDEGVAKIGDFGLSKFQSNEPCTSQVGTPYYAAPEIAQGLPYNSKCDIWSLGMAFYKMLNKGEPWERKTGSWTFKEYTTPTFSPELNISDESTHLMRQMLTEKQEHRIDWEVLFTSTDNLFHKLSKGIPIDKNFTPEERKEILKKANDYVFLMIEVGKSIEYQIKITIANKQHIIEKSNELCFCQVIFVLSKLKMIIMSDSIIISAGIMQPSNFPKDAVVFPEFEPTVKLLQNNFDEAKLCFKNMFNSIRNLKPLFKDPKEFTSIFDENLFFTESFQIVARQILLVFWWVLLNPIVNKDLRQLARFCRAIANSIKGGNTYQICEALKDIKEKAMNTIKLSKNLKEEEENKE